MATISDVDGTVKALVARLHDAGHGQREGLPDLQRSLALVVRDLGVTYRGRYGGGRISDLERVEGAAPADIVLTLTSDDLVALAEGTLGVPAAMLSGRLRVKAPPGDLLALRRIL